MNPRDETREHISQVRLQMTRAIVNLLNRAQVHDASKLEPPEAELFEKYTPELASLTYGSPEYKSCLAKIKPALDHHYARNSHHPEHWKDGIRGMSLLDLSEMICDWKAATLRHNDGNINFSIQKNQERFGFSDELKQILINTVDELRMT